MIISANKRNSQLEDGMETGNVEDLVRALNRGLYGFNDSRGRPDVQFRSVDVNYSRVN